MNEKIISTLVGLAGACSNNGKTEHTDSIVMNALLNCCASEDGAGIVDAIRKEKFTISPNCETCSVPCGNTSDYDMERFHQNKELMAIKKELIEETAALTARIHSAGKSVLPDEIYKAISFFGYELSEESYRNLINTLKQMEV